MSEQLTAFVYAIGSPSGPTKIGHSLEPEQRLAAFKRDGHRDAVIYGTWPVGASLALQTERYAHWLLRDRHITNEWFDCSRDEALAAIQRASIERHDPTYAVPRLDVVGREIKGGEQIATRFPKGTRERLLKASPGSYAQFIREAVLAELERREKAKS